MLEEILEYQKLDAKLVAVEQEIANSKAKKVVNQMAEFVKTAQMGLVNIEKNASTLIQEYEELNTKFENLLKEVETITKIKFDDLDNTNLIEQEKRANECVAELLVVEKNISNLSKKINNTLKEFDTTKAKGMQAKQRHTQGMKEYNDLVNKKETEIAHLKSELLKIEKSVDKKLLEKYKKMREDKKFPVFVPLISNSCGGCSMQLPTSQLNKLEQAGMMECENCRRVIFINKK